MRGQGDHDTGLAALLRLAAPIVGSRLGVMAMGLTDAIVVGQYSAVELGYHTLAWAPSGVALMAGLGLLSGIPVLTARRIGEGRPELTGAVLRRGVVYSALLGLAALLFLHALALFGLPLVGFDPALATGAARAMRVLSYSIPLIFISSAAVYWLEAQGRASIATAAMWAGNIVNLTVNLWLVPGASGLPVAGAVASFWATFFARLFICAILLGFLLRWRDTGRLGVWRRAPSEPAAAIEQRRIGYAAGASYSVESAAFAAMSLFAGWLGAAHVAAWGVILNVASIVFMVPLGLAGATNVLVGRAFGARDATGVLRAFRLGCYVTAGVLAAICAVVLFDAGLIARWYTAEPVVLALSVAALHLSCLFYIADGLQVVAGQSLRARGDVWWPTALHVFSYLVVMIPIGWWLSRTSGLNGMVWAIVIASLVSATLLIARFLLLGRTLARDPSAVTA